MLFWKFNPLRSPEDMGGYGDAILPDDYQGEPAQPQAEGEEPVEGTPTEPQEPEGQTEKQTEEPIKIPYKFNGEEGELPLEEAQPLIQKGMNYDKVFTKLQEIENGPVMQLINDLANQSGMTIEQYVQAARENMKQQELNELIQKNIPEDLAREMIENKRFREEYQVKEKQRQAEEKTKTEVDNELSDFRKAYPGVKNQDIPKEVWDKVNEGVPLKYAYMEYERGTLQNQISILKTNKSNEQKAPINGVTLHGTKNAGADDLFMQGFNSVT
jgi:hypothetical protein